MVLVDMGSEEFNPRFCILIKDHCLCNELRVIWPIPHKILSVITRSTIIT